MVVKGANLMNKKIIASAVAVLLVVAAAIGIPQLVKAINADSVIYEQNENYKELWNEKEAPQKAGYVFGGWYEKSSGEYVALQEETVSSYNGDVYAKFVPAYVLSVKAQNKLNTKEGDGATSMRVVSSVDAGDYKKVGFEIWIANEKQVTKAEGAPLETERVYSALKCGEEVRTAKQLFGNASEYLMVWRLDNIADTLDTTNFYIRPYWITADGTKVEGLSKYVHVEDGYNRYVSIPVNLMTGELIAAGMLDVVCDDDRFEFYDVEIGRVFDEMDSLADAEKISIVGQTESGNANADGLFANVRFKLKDGAKFEAGKGEFITFQIGQEEFCNWDEESATVDAWDYKY